MWHYSFDLPLTSTEEKSNSSNLPEKKDMGKIIDSTPRAISKKVKVVTLQSLFLYVSNGKKSNDAFVDECNTEKSFSSVIEENQNANTQYLEVPEKLNNAMERESYELLVLKD